MSIILEKGEGHVIQVDRSFLTSRLGDVFSASALQSLSTLSGLTVAALQNMTVIAFIKADIASKDVFGYKKYAEPLRKAGYDV